MAASHETPSTFDKGLPNGHGDSKFAAPIRGATRTAMTFTREHWLPIALGAAGVVAAVVVFRLLTRD